MTTTNQIPQECPYCQSPLQEKKGVSKKTGENYHFWSCVSYPQCRYSWTPTQKPAQNAPQRQSGANNNDLIAGRLNTIEKLIVGEFKTINTRLDNMAQWLSDNIPNKAE